MFCVVNFESEFSSSEIKVMSMNLLLNDYMGAKSYACFGGTRVQEDA